MNTYNDDPNAMNYGLDNLWGIDGEMFYDLQLRYNLTAKTQLFSTAGYIGGDKDDNSASGRFAGTFGIRYNH